MIRHFIQDCCNRYKDHCDGIFQCAEKIGLNSEYKEKWGFFAREWRNETEEWKIDKATC